MATTYTRGSGVSPNTSGAIISPSAEARAAWPLFSALVAAKQALWIDPSDPRYYRKGGAADAPGTFKLLDRAGGRIFTPELIRNRHPFIVADSVTGRPVFVFGGGGASPNDLSNTSNGALVTASILDALGAETNNLPLFLPDVGWSVAFKARAPVANTTMNGVAFGANPGGMVLGGYGDNANYADSFAVGLDSAGSSAGFLRAYNQAGIQTASQYFSKATDYRDAAWHDYVVTYDDTIGTYSAWVDGVAATPQAGCTTDIAVTSNVNKPMIGAYGGASSGPSNRFGGCLAFLAYLPSPTLANSANRALIRTLMATR